MRNNAEPEDRSRIDGDLDLAGILPWFEFGCWTALALIPLLYFVNGTSVSTDQAVMRSILIASAVVGAVGCRLWNWTASRRGSAREEGDHDV